MAEDKEAPPCPCNGTGLVHRKGWKQAYNGPVLPAPFGVHPAIAAHGSYRTVVSSPCSCPRGRAREEGKNKEGYIKTIRELVGEGLAQGCNEVQIGHAILDTYNGAWERLKNGAAVRKALGLEEDEYTDITTFPLLGAQRTAHKHMHAFLHGEEEGAG